MSETYDNEQAMYYTALQDARRSLLEYKRQNQHALDKVIMTLASGGIVLSLSIAEKIATDLDAKLLSTLNISEYVTILWAIIALFTGGIFFSILTYVLTNFYMDKNISTIDNMIIHERRFEKMETEIRAFKKITSFLRGIAVLALFGAVFLLFYSANNFAIDYLSVESKDNNTQQMDQSNKKMIEDGNK